jgi:AraC family transcriptional regulator
MKATINQAYYEARLSRVTAYIHDHLDEELDLNKLADIACLSPYHWHRIYHAVLGETIAATVKRLRLQRAAALLAHSDLPIGQVAKQSAYDNLQSFTRIFAAAYGLPPAQYRQQGSHLQYQQPPQTRSNIMFKVEIKTITGIKAVALNHSGSYQSIGRTLRCCAAC